MLKISTSAGEKKGSMNIVIEQIQDNIFSFSIEMLLSDSGGTRKITIPVKERVTRKIVDSGPDLKVTPDPDVKLLFRQVM